MRVAQAVAIVTLVVSARAAAQQAAVGDAPASTNEIVNAVRDCAAAVTPGKFDQKVFEAAGWRFAGSKRITTGGSPAEEGYFGRTGGNVINVVRVVDRFSTSCTTQAKLNSAGQLVEVRKRLSLALALKTFDAYQGDAEYKSFMRKSSGDTSNVLIGDSYRLLVVPSQADKAPGVYIMMMPKRAVEKK